MALDRIVQGEMKREQRKKSWEYISMRGASQPTMFLFCDQRSMKSLTNGNQSYFHLSIHSSTLQYFFIIPKNVHVLYVSKMIILNYTATISKFLFFHISIPFLF